jgi:antitoxin HigA-1
MAKKLKPRRPGEVLLIPASSGSPANRRALPALGTTPQLWLNLQIDYDVQVAKRDLIKSFDRIETENKSQVSHFEFRVSTLSCPLRLALRTVDMHQKAVFARIRRLRELRFRQSG